MEQNKTATVSRKMALVRQNGEIVAILQRNKICDMRQREAADMLHASYKLPKEYILSNSTLSIHASSCFNSIRIFNV